MNLLINKWRAHFHLVTRSRKLFHKNNGGDWKKHNSIPENMQANSRKDAIKKYLLKESYIVTPTQKQRTVY